MGSVIPLKKSANSAYLELKNLLGRKLKKVEELIELKLKSDVNLIEQMSEHHLKSGGKRLRALLTLESARLTGNEENKRDINFTKDGKINSIHNLEKWLWIKKIRSKFPKSFKVFRNWLNRLR